ncbi:MAG: site-specific integrase [Muribaculaceae bacterium]|nr:site-specific integrase [Muribaculaceae bacterium]
MPKKNLRTGGDILGYSMPKFHPSKKTPYVDVYAFDPVTNTRKRKKYHIPASLRPRQQREYAAELIAGLIAKLRTGWSPWTDMAENNSSIIPIQTAVERYLKHMERDLRRKTFLSYSSRATIFLEFLQQMPCPPKYTYQMDRTFAVAFLDYVYLDRNNSARTRNNYLGWLGTFCSFLVERGMLSANPTEHLRKIPESDKKRQPLTVDMMRRMTEYLMETDRYFLLACMMQYYTLIRPSELCRLKIGDISVKNNTIFVAASISKNKRADFVGIPDSLLSLMVDLNILDKPTGMYIFGSDFRPSAVHHGPDIFNKRWKKMRKALGWSDEYQFYSLKDTGIRDIANTAGIVTARDQARHTDISTTNKYLKGKYREVPSTVRKFEGAVGDIILQSDKTRP